MFLSSISDEFEWIFFTFRVDQKRYKYQTKDEQKFYYKFIIKIQKLKHKCADMSHHKLLVMVQKFIFVLGPLSLWSDDVSKNSWISIHIYVFINDLLQKSNNTKFILTPNLGIQATNMIKEDVLKEEIANFAAGYYSFFPWYFICLMSVVGRVGLIKKCIFSAISYWRKHVMGYR